MGTPAVFLDLGGTLVQPILVNHPQELQPVADAASAVARLCIAGFLCPVVTVQSRIEKGVFTEAEFLAWFAGFTQQMRNAGAVLIGPYVCPHRYRTKCGCAKPATTLHRRAAADWDIDLSRSFTIGDTMADVQAAWDFGGKGCLVNAFAAGVPRSPDYIASSLTDAVAWVCAMKSSER